MKIDALAEFANNYETYFEILPKESNTVIVAGKAEGISDAEKKDVLEELKKIKVAHKEEATGRTFTLFKAGLKVFLDNSFIYYEHYLADYRLSGEEICSILQIKKKFAEEHLTDILSGLNKEKKAAITSLALLRLEGKTQQEIVGAIKGNGGIELQNTEEEKYKKFCFNIYLSNGHVLFTSPYNWKICHNGIRSFVYSIRSLLPNPKPSINNMERVQLVKRAHEEFLRKCNILSVEVLREQNKTILKRVFLPVYIFILPLLILAVYIALSTKSILGVFTTLSVFFAIGATLLWFWKSTSKM